MPEASFRFEEGQCATAVPSAARSRRSSSLGVDHVREDRRGPRDPEVAQVLDVRAAAPRPHELDLVAVLGGVRVDEDPLRAGPGGRLPEDPVGAGDGEARAPGEAEPPVRPLPCQRAKSRSPSASASSVSAKSSGGFVDGSSISAFPLVTLRPEASAARKTASVCLTVPMSRIAVVPPAASSARPRRAERKSVSSSWAASPGQTCVFSHGRSGRSSGPLRRSVWQRWMWVWTNPGKSQSPSASTRSTGSPRCGGGRGGGPRLRAEGADDSLLGPDGAVRVEVVGRAHSGDEGVLDEKGAHPAEYRPAGAARRDGRRRTAGGPGPAPAPRGRQGAGGAGGQGVSGRSARRGAVEAEGGGDRHLRGEDEGDELRQGPAPLLRAAPHVLPVDLLRERLLLQPLQDRLDRDVGDLLRGTHERAGADEAGQLVGRQDRLLHRRLARNARVEGVAADRLDEVLGPGALPEDLHAAEDVVRLGGVLLVVEVVEEADEAPAFDLRLVRRAGGAGEVAHRGLHGEGVAAERLRSGELGQEGPGVLAGRSGHGREYPSRPDRRGYKQESFICFDENSRCHDIRFKNLLDEMGDVHQIPRRSGQIRKKEQRWE